MKYEHGPYPLSAPCENNSLLETWTWALPSGWACENKSLLEISALLPGWTVQDSLDCSI